MVYVHELVECEFPTKDSPLTFETPTTAWFQKKGEILLDVRNVAEVCVEADEAGREHLLFRWNNGVSDLIVRLTVPRKTVELLLCSQSEGNLAGGDDIG